MAGREMRSAGVRRSAVALICCSGFLLVCGTGAQPASGKEIVVSAAISLKNAFEQIGKSFAQKHPGEKVIFNFGASGDLARQIAAGARVDVFASAAQKDMEDIGKRNLIAVNAMRIFAKNGMVLVKPARCIVSLQGVEDLRNKEVKRIVIGNPKTVPAGRYAEEALRHFKLWEAIKNKLIFAENARQALDYVARDEVDAGLVFSTDAMARAKEVKVVMNLPEGSHQPVVYLMGVINETKEEALARAFVDFVISQEGQKILTRYGFLSVNS